MERSKNVLAEQSKGTVNRGRAAGTEDRGGLHRGFTLMWGTELGITLFKVLIINRE